jgi:hypothetical protein
MAYFCKHKFQQAFNLKGMIFSFISEYVCYKMEIFSFNIKDKHNKKVLII